MSADDVPIGRIKHPAVREARARLRAGEAFLADGQRLVAQAVEAGAAIEGLFFLDPAEAPGRAALLKRAEAAGLDCHLVTRGVFFKVLGLGYETSVRVLAVVRRPEPLAAPDLGADGAVLVGERIQDPRNVGVMVRTADAWCLPCAAFGADSADPYSRPAVRSSTGSIFRVPLALPADLPGFLGALKGEGARIVGSSARADVPCWDADLTGRCALVLGNESEGLSDEVRAACDEVVTVPMSGGASSFNVTVAAGVLLYERERQRRRTLR